MKKNKTVFVTNIWVSYFLQAKFTELVAFVEQNEVVFYRDILLLNELTEVMNRPKFKKYFKLPVSEYLAFFEELSILINTKNNFLLVLIPMIIFYSI